MKEEIIDIIDSSNSWEEAADQILQLFAKHHGKLLIDITVLKEKVRRLEAELKGTCTAEKQGDVVGYVNIYNTRSGFTLGTCRTEEEAGLFAELSPDHFIGTVPIRLPKATHRITREEALKIASDILHHAEQERSQPEQDGNDPGVMGGMNAPKPNRPYPATTGELLWEDACKQTEQDTARVAVEWLRWCAGDMQDDLSLKVPDDIPKLARFILANLRPEALPKRLTVMRIEFEGKVPSGKLKLWGSSIGEYVNVLKSTVEELPE